MDEQAPKQQPQQQPQRPRDPVEYIPFGSADWQTLSAESLKENGVVVITGVFTPEECDARMTDLVGHFKTLSPKLSPYNWKSELLPNGPRPGLFQSLVGQFPTVWHLRTDPRVREIFTAFYSNFRGKQVDDFVCSADGVNVRPPIGPFHRDGHDWAHLDQSKRGCELECVQGQVVLTNTTACFRCSPRSNKVIDQVLDECEVYNENQWCKFTPGQVPAVRNIVEQVDGAQWQVPVVSDKGSMVFWLSSTIHSARLQLPDSPIDRTDRWSQWRGVVYICYRPKEEVDQKHLQTLQKAFRENRVTNHWGSKIFAHVRGNPKKAFAGVSEHMQRLLRDPSLAYKLRGMKPELTPEIRALIS